ncbi:MAG: repair protein RecO [Blastocatellia bacterium]|jgi:DNA repair protein RecO (recombination protein O)|nr:repair protein RecO [Blastocatellia bacterium]
MGLVETEAVVLRVYPLAEADKIVVCLTRSAGVVRAVAKGARRLKSKFGAGLEPFTLLDLSYYEKEGRELVTLRQTEIQRSYFKLSERAETVAALSYLSELVLEFAPPHEPNEKLFRMVRATLEAVPQGAADLNPLLRYFEVWTLKLAGFMPELRRCAECGRVFNEAEQSYLNAEFKMRCKVCSHQLGMVLGGPSRAQIHKMLRLSPLDYSLKAAPFERASLDEIAQLTRKLIGHALERSPRVHATLV